MFVQSPFRRAFCVYNVNVAFRDAIRNMNRFENEHLILIPSYYVCELRETACQVCSISILQISL
jgi:hypothetical protein